MLLVTEDLTLEWALPRGENGFVGGGLRKGCKKTLFNTTLISCIGDRSRKMETCEKIHNMAWRHSP